MPHWDQKAHEVLSSIDILRFGNSKKKKKKKRIRLFLCKDGRGRQSSSWRGKEKCQMHTVGDSLSEATSGSMTGVLFYGDKETNC